MIKKIAILSVLFVTSVSLISCGNKKSTDTNETNSSVDVSTSLDNSSTYQNEDLSSSEIDTSTTAESSDTLSWPTEFANWNVPVIESATLLTADNKSMDGQMITQGKNALVSLSDVTQDDYNSYKSTLEKEGFVRTEDSLDNILEYYEKEIDGGLLTITLSFSEDTTTILVNNSSITDDTSSFEATTGWPESLSDIPEFTKGSYKETVDMGGGMYAITYNDVTESDLDWYRSQLTSNGFFDQELEDTEGYGKVDANGGYSVGFVLEGSTLQIIAIYSSY